VSGYAAAAPPSSFMPGVSKTSAQEFKPVEFGKLVVRLQVGYPFFIVQQGPACVKTKTLTYPGGVSDYKLPGAREIFHDELVASGLAVAGDPNNLFETAASADYVISGIATEFQQEVCSPNAVGDAALIQKGMMHMTIEWQLYSRLQKQVLATVRTRADYQLDEAVSGGGNVLAAKAFELNVRQLAVAPEIRAVLAGRPLAENEKIEPTPESPISLAGALSAQPRGVQDSVGSVVLVRRGAGFGSGFLISRDGYILTAAHVVDEATTVRIRWADRTETEAQVVRVSKGRDVALLKADSHGRAPLAMFRGVVAPSTTVYAIGAPLDQDLQGSVTRGVVSAVRVLHGYSYVQSDVSISPGNSGGPLIDEQGRVVGLAVLGARIQNAPQGVNLFVPTNDAIAFLSLELR
jgi:S1-C subfamily serine protease